MTPPTKSQNHHQSSKVLQNQYNEICKALGDAHYKRKQLDNLISQLESQLDHLNSVSYPLVSLVESQQDKKTNQSSKEL